MFAPRLLVSRDLATRPVGAPVPPPEAAGGVPFKGRSQAGSGKILPGLVIADWVRRTRSARVAYACRQPSSPGRSWRRPAGGRVLIRPLIPATSENRLFAGARRWLYLSATRGDVAELERAFGRTGIVRLTLQAGVPVPRSGRRFVVLPEQADHGDPAALVAAAVAAAGKALALAPDTDTAVGRAREQAQPGWPGMTIDDVGEGMGRSPPRRTRRTCLPFRRLTQTGRLLR